MPIPSATISTSAPAASQIAEDRIDVADLEREEAVGSVFYQLRAVHIGHEHWSTEWLVDSLHQIGCAITGAPDHDAIPDSSNQERRNLPQEFRVGDDVELRGFCCNA
jgi:hypothetical protein